jgi:hypothetical protein
MLTMGTRLGPYEIVVPLTAPRQQKDEALDVSSANRKLCQPLCVHL